MRLPAEAVDRHLADSLSGLQVPELRAASRIADVGAGAGFPGLALAAALPELPYACGLATVALLTADVVTEPLVAVDGVLPVRRPDVDPVAVGRLTATAERARWWRARVGVC